MSKKRRTIIGSQKEMDYDYGDIHGDHGNRDAWFDKLWSSKHMARFMEERFEKDVFFMYTSITDSFPYELKVWFTIIIKVVWFVIAIYIASSFYITDQYNSYISLKNHPGCTEVPIPINNEFTLDATGQWNGHADHEESTSYVRVKLSLLTTTLAEFTTFMEGVTDVISAETRASQRRDLAANLASMMAWQNNFFTDNRFGLTKHVIEFTADAAFVFSRFYLVATISSVADDCDVYIDALFDRSTGVLRATLEAEDYLASPRCSSVLDPEHLGYDPFLTGPNIRVQFDMHSLITAHAINSGLADLQAFSRLADPQFLDFDVDFGDDEYHLHIGIDEKFPGMDPVFCLLPADRRNATDSYLFQTLCVIKVGGHFVYPIFNHAGLAGHDGFDLYDAKMCECADGSGNLPYCSEFDFLTGFLMFGEDDPDAAFRRLLRMAYRHSPQEINRLSYNASFSSSRLGGLAYRYPPKGHADADSAKYSLLSDPVWRTEAYAFCDNCSVFSLRAYDEFDYRVNSAGLQIFNGSCNDVVSAHVQWQPETMAPPSQIVENFFKCKPTPFDSMVNGLGIGVGDSTIVVPTLVIIVIPLIHLFLHYCQSPQSKRYQRHRFAELHAGMVMGE